MFLGNLTDSVPLSWAKAGWAPRMHKKWLWVLDTHLVHRQVYNQVMLSNVAAGNYRGEQASGRTPRGSSAQPGASGTSPGREHTWAVPSSCTEFRHTHSGWTHGTQPCPWVSVHLCPTCAQRGDFKSKRPEAPARADAWLGLAWRQNSVTCLLHRHPDDIGGHDLDDVQLQDPPQECLQLVEALQEPQEQHCEAVDHQVPLVPQICKAGHMTVSGDLACIDGSLVPLICKAGHVHSCQWKPGLYGLFPQFLAHC